MKFTDKYSPNSLDEIIYPSPSVEQKVLAYSKGYFQGNLLFHGVPGNGKSTCAGLVIDALGSNGADLNSFNCSLTTTKDEVPLKVQSIASVMPIVSDVGTHFFILEEVDGLSVSAQKAMKDIMDDAASRSLFVATTNYLEKLEIGFRDRFPQKVSFDHIGQQYMLQFAELIAAKERLNIGNQSLEPLVLEANGSIRNLLGRLEELVGLAKLNSMGGTDHAE